jgi:hypothetical protein
MEPDNILRLLSCKVRASDDASLRYPTVRGYIAGAMTGDTDYRSNGRAGLLPVLLIVVIISVVSLLAFFR